MILSYWVLVTFHGRTVKLPESIPSLKLTLHRKRCHPERISDLPYLHNHPWLVVSTHLKNISQHWKSSPTIGVKRKNLWNHQLVQPSHWKHQVTEDKTQSIFFGQYKWDRLPGLSHLDFRTKMTTQKVSHENWYIFTYMYWYHEN